MTKATPMNSAATPLSSCSRLQRVLALKQLLRKSRLSFVLRSGDLVCIDSVRQCLLLQLNVHKLRRIVWSKFCLTALTSKLTAANSFSYNATVRLAAFVQTQFLQMHKDALAWLKARIKKASSLVFKNNQSLL